MAETDRPNMQISTLKIAFTHRFCLGFRVLLLRYEQRPYQVSSCKHTYFFLEACIFFLHITFLNAINVAK